MFVLCYIFEMSVAINKHPLLRALPMVGSVGLETSRKAKYIRVSPIILQQKSALRS